jgi:hypothetical protein
MLTPRDGRQRVASAFTHIAASLRGSGGRKNGLSHSPSVNVCDIESDKGDAGVVRAD